MTKPENGLYMAEVTDEGAKMMHADENAVCDAQIGKMFKKKDESRAVEETAASQDQRKLTRQAAMKKRHLLCMVKDVSGLLSAAALVYLTHEFGLYVAIAAITGCIVAAACRFIGYVEKGREDYAKS